MRAFLVEHALDERGAIVFALVIFLQTEIVILTIAYSILIRVVLEQLLILLLVLKIRVLQVLALLSGTILETLKGVSAAVVGSFSMLSLLVLEVEGRIVWTLHIFCIFRGSGLERSLLIGSGETLTARVARTSRKEWSLRDLFGTSLTCALFLLLLLEPLIEGRLGG